MIRAGHISAIREYAPQSYLVLNETARRNLEIFQRFRTAAAPALFFP